MTGPEGRRPVITGPFDSVRGMYRGRSREDARRSRTGTAKSRPSRNSSPVHVSDLRVDSAGAGVDLGEQAPVDADAARQHRRGVVDHHRGRADHRRQRRRSPTRSCRTSAPTRSPSSGWASRRTKTTSSGCATTRIVTIDDAAAVKRFATVGRVDHGAGAEQTRVAYRDEELETLQVQGVSEEYLDFATFDAERGRMITPTEITRKRQVTLIGWSTADRLFGAADPLDKQIRVAGVPFRVVGVSKKKGAAFGQSLDEFVVIPLGAYQKLFGARQSLALMVKPRDAVAGQQAQGRSARRDARRARPEAVGSPTTSASRLRFGARHLPAGDRRHRRRAGRHRRAVAAGRRHRDHEHHADGGQRADARDRPAQGARRQAARHHVAGAHRIDHAVAGRRHRSASRSARCSRRSSRR